jgi:hypothetical protein
MENGGTGDMTYGSIIMRVIEKTVLTSVSARC